MHSPPHPLPTSYHLHVNFPTGIIKSYFKNLRKPLEVSVLHFYLMKFIFFKESEIFFFPFSLFLSVQFCSVAQSCPTLCDLMDCSRPGLPVHHQLPEFTQTHVHCGEGNGNPLQYSCLENPKDGGAWWAAVHGVAGSDTTERLHFLFSLSCIGEGNGNPFQCSCLENPRDGGAWWAAVYGVIQSWTQLKRLSSSSMSIESVMPSNHLILCHPFLLLPSIFPSIRVFSNELVLRIRWSKYWSFSFSSSPSNEYSRLISSRMD